MALPGMKSTADFAADERPKNFREGILLRSPRNNAPLFALTAAMESEETDDPEFAWWEEDVQSFVLELGAGNLTNVATTVPLASGGSLLKPGDMIRASATGEVMRITTVNSDTSITVQRAIGPGGTPAGTAAALTTSTGGNKTGQFIYLGSAYREGAPRSIGTSLNPTKVRNYTQIFRTPVEWTRTAMKTRYRTGDAQRNDKRRALHKHSLGIENAFIFGTPYETLENGQPLRTTGGILNFIPAGNQYTLTAAGVDLDELEDQMINVFQYGSNEKVAWGSVKTLTLVSRILRKNGKIELGPTGEKEYGFNVRRIYTAAGTLVLMEHPLFSFQNGPLVDDLVIMDTAQLRYRYITDTTYLQNRQDNGTDGKTDEYLTECGLEVQNGNTMYWLKGLKKAAVDD